MAINDEYLKRLWALHNASRSDRVASPSDLLKVLRKDFEGARRIFSEAEYKNPDLRDTIVEDITHPDRGAYSVPVEVASFLRELLGPGPVLSLYSGVGDLLFQFGAGVGVEPNGFIADWSKLFVAMAEADARIITEDPLKWRTGEKFDRIVCNPLFGVRVGESGLFGKMLSLMKDGGRTAVIVPGATLWRIQATALRKLIAESARVSAVISLPSNVFARTSIQTAVLILEKAAPGKTYLAASKNVADFRAIAADYAAWSSGKQFSLGFEAELDPVRWDSAFYEPIDFGLGGIDFTYKVVALGDIAKIVAGKASSEAKIAVNRTGSKAVWVADEPGLIARNNIFVMPSERVNPSYLLLYLNSALGRRALGRFVKGESIPHISPGDLAQVSVVLPDLSVQSAIAEDALELRRTVTGLESLVTEGKLSLKENIFGLASARMKFQNFSASTEKAFYQTLPFPIAVVYHKIANAPNNTQRFSSLIDLFEVAVRFIVLVHLADYINNRRQASIVAQQIPAIKKLYGPSLGDWVDMFGAFAHIKSATDSKPFLEEIKNFKLNRYQRTLKEFVGIRNSSLRGHGATLTEDEYELRFQEHAPKVYDLISSLGFLANYTLVKTGTMEKDGDFYKIAVQLLRGDNPHFEHSSILLRTPLDTNRVLYLNRQQESLVLDPYIVLERCPECKRPEVLLLDSFSGKKVTYLGYESGHRPALENAERLPAVIREVARRESITTSSSD